MHLGIYARVLFFAQNFRKEVHVMGHGDNRKGGYP